MYVRGVVPIYLFSLLGEAVLSLWGGGDERVRHSVSGVVEEIFGLGRKLHITVSLKVWEHTARSWRRAVTTVEYALYGET